MLNKEQQKYLQNQLHDAAQAQRRAIDLKYPIEQKDEQQLVAALLKAGFVIKDNYYVTRGIGFKPTAQHNKNVAKRQALHNKLNEAVRTATDAIMLGDNKDAVAALAKFRTTIAKVI